MYKAVGQGKTTNLNFGFLCGKAKGRLFAHGLVHSMIKRRHRRLVILPQKKQEARRRHSHRRSEKASESSRAYRNQQNLEEVIATPNGKVAMQNSRNMENQENLITPKDHNNLPVTSPKDMEIWDSPNKKSK